MAFTSILYIRRSIGCNNIPIRLFDGNLGSKRNLEWLNCDDINMELVHIYFGQSYYSQIFGTTWI